MKTFKIKNKSFQIRNDDYKKLLKRFDIKNFSNNFPMVNSIPCALCKRYKNCINCPLDSFRTKQSYGCIIIIKNIIKKTRIPHYISLGIYDVVLFKRKYRKEIEEIYKFLEGAK